MQSCCNMTCYILVLKVPDLNVQKSRFSCNNAFSFHLFFKLSYYMVNIHSFFFSVFEILVLVDWIETAMPLQPWQTNSDHSAGVRGQARPSAALFISSKHWGVDGCSCFTHQVATALSFNARSLLTSPPVVQSTLPNATGITSNDSCHLSQYEGICNKPGLMNQTNNESERAGVPV